MKHRLAASDDNASIINISGKQRMLSQRITLSACMIADASSLDDADHASEQLRQSILEMEKAHIILSTGSEKKNILSPQSHELQDLYFPDENSLEVGVDAKVKRFLKSAQAVLDQYNQKNNVSLTEFQSSLKRSESFVTVVELGPGVLLDKLDRVVSQYELEAYKEIQKFDQLFLVLTLISLVVLFLTVIFIFQPLIERIKEQNRIVMDQKKVLQDNNLEDIAGGLKGLGKYFD